MCGIVGLISKHAGGFWNAQVDLFTNLLIYDSIRGPDSTGAFGVTKQGHLDIVKGDADGYLFARSDVYSKFASRIKPRYSIVIGHNRKATKGAIKAENAHPFREGHITLVHNGTIYNANDLHAEAEVDSHAIARALAAQDAAGALEKLNGAYALVWFDAKLKTLNLARNAARPLFLVEYPDVWIISSEIGLPIWLQRRANIVEDKIMEIPTHKILSFTLDTLNKAPTELSFKEYSAYVPPVTNYTWRERIFKNKWAVGNKPGRGPFLPDPPNKSSVIPLRPVTDKLKSGDVIMVRFDDAKSDDAASNGGQIAIGCPVIENEVHENLIVHYHILSEEFETFYDQMIKYEYFDAVVSATGVYRGQPLVYVRNVTPHRFNKSYNGTHLSNDELKLIESLPCVRCRGKVVKEDINKILVKRRADNTYRVLCPTCLQTSVENAKMRKEGAANVH